MVAINEEFATDSEIIQEKGDIIAFIPPVSGGSYAYRYSRQVLFSPNWHRGQTRLFKACMLSAQAHLALGNAEMLTRAGVGKLTIVDRDYVEESNLQRQQLYTEEM